MNEKPGFDGSNLSSEMYAHIREGITIHRSARECFLVCPTPPVYYTISKDLTYFLICCDGMSTVGDLLIEHIYDEQGFSEKQSLDNILLISRLIKEGAIVLTETPVKQPPKVMDSTTFIPSNIQLEITTSCNLRCYYCYRAAGSKKTANPVRTEKLLEKLSQLAEYGVSSIEITGGEPLLHPDFMEIMALCYQKFVLIGLLTNGTLFNNAILEQLVPFKDKMAVSVSLDCHIPEIHDWRRGQKGSFAKTVKAVQSLAEYGFLTRVSMVLDKDNWEHIEPTLLLARKLGANSFGYAPILPFGRGGKHFAFWDAFVRDFLQKHNDLAAKYPGFLNIKSGSDTLELQKPGGCGAGYRVFAMDPSGYVRPCVTFAENTAIFGNLYESSPEQIFGSELSYCFAQTVAPDIGACGGCRYEFFCRYCVLRGLTASKWLEPGKCNWLNQPENRKISELIKKSL